MILVLLGIILIISATLVAFFYVKKVLICHDVMVKKNELNISCLDRELISMQIAKELLKHKPIEVFYNLDVDRAKTNELNKELLEAISKNEQLVESIRDVQILKGIIKRGHETFYKNRCGEFWSKPDGFGGYLIYKNGEFYDNPNK